MVNVRSIITGSLGRLAARVAVALGQTELSMRAHITGVVVFCWFVSLLIFISAPNHHHFAWPLAKNLDSWLSVVGINLYVLLILGLGLIFLHRHEPALPTSPRHIYLLGLVYVLAVLGCRLTFPISPYLSFLPAATMLLSFILHERTSGLTGILLAVSCGLVFDVPPAATIVNAIGSVVAVFAVTGIHLRYDLARSGLIVALVNMIGIAAMTIMFSPTVLLGHWMDLFWGALGGVGSAVAAIGLLPFIEDNFGIVTPFKLMEYADPNQPLLRQLLLKAPGTYHHSIIVGNLGETAAEAIGADPLLTRVGALYHDIGKVVRPYFFIENQMGIDNQHSRIAPRLSAIVITAHVREGLEIARENALPAMIRNFIAQHHGQGLVAYFYHQARQTESPEGVREEHFRYPGPKPNTRETAIIMLADSVEAAVRSLVKPTAEQIEATVDRIFRARIDDGQLSDAPLTLRDLEVIRETFLRILQGLYHTRIEYPEDIFKDLGSRPRFVGHGRADRELPKVDRS